MKHGIVVKEEYEFKIKNKENFLALMTDLGFKKWIGKTKITEFYGFCTTPQNSVHFRDFYDSQR